MKVKITSDSTCDLSPELIEKYDIAITPLSVHCGDKVGRDGVEITPEIIYDYVDASGQLPRTSAVNVFDYVREFRHWRQQGYSIVHFCISSDFSSSYQNACIAAADIGQVYVVDSRNLSTGQGLLVLHGAELADRRRRRSRRPARTWLPRWRPASSSTGWTICTRAAAVRPSAPSAETC